MTQPKRFISDIALIRATSRRLAENTRFKTRDYLLHQAVANLFGDRPDRGYLFYEIGRRKDRTAELLVLSDRPPTEGLPEVSPWQITRLRTKPFIVRLPSGAVLDFEIRVNATVVRTTARGRKGGRVRRKRRVDVWDALWGEHRDTDRTRDDVYAEYLGRKLAAADRKSVV